MRSTSRRRFDCRAPRLCPGVEDVHPGQTPSRANCEWPYILTRGLRHNRCLNFEDERSCWFAIQFRVQQKNLALIEFDCLSAPHQTGSRKHQPRTRPTSNLLVLGRSTEQSRTREFLSGVWYRR